MKLIVNLKLKPLESQFAALLETVERSNAACNWISEQAFANKVYKQFSVHKIVYLETKERFGLSSQMVIRAIAKVADSYVLDQKVQRTFRKHGAVTYDSRILTFKQVDKVSLWTLEGRQTIPFVCGEHQRKLLPYLKDEVDLIYRKGQFFLNCVCDIEEAPFRDEKEFLGIDLGIVELATDSDGKSFSGRQVEKRRNRFANLRTKLQTKGTPSAKRHLQRLCGKQQNYQKSENHRISKRIVEKAKGTHRSIALEDLSGIRSGVTVRRWQKAKIANWSFYGLQKYVAYKAKREGVNVVFVDPAYTSQQCSECLHTEKANRKSQSEFLCKSCGFSANADHNAAVNIKLRAMSTGSTVRTRTSVAASCQLQTPSITVSV